MSMRSKRKCARWLGEAALRFGLGFGLALAAGFLIPAHATTEGEASAVDAPRHQAPPRHHSGPSLEERIKTLSQALGLDATQQSELRKALESYREQLGRVSRDPSVPAAYRVGAVQAISEQTIERIRAFLNDEQKRKFHPPPPRDAAQSSPKPGLEAGMNAAKPR